MRFEVPQFIEVEDKIIGPFTWRQFIYLAGGGGAAAILFFTLPFFLFALIGVPIMILAGFLAFHRVNNRPFSNFLESGFNYFTKNKLYLWRKRDEEVITQSEPEPAEESPSGTLYAEKQSPQHLPSPAANNIASLSRKLELSTLEQEQK